MDRVPYIQANFAEEMYQSCQKHMSLSLHMSVPIGHQWSAYTGVKLNLCTSELDGTVDDDNIISSNTQTQLHFSPLCF